MSLAPEPIPVTFFKTHCIAGVDPGSTLKLSAEPPGVAFRFAFR